MDDGNDMKALGVPSEESPGATSQHSEVIRTTELGTLDSRKSNLKQQVLKKPTKPKQTKGVVLSEDCFGLLHGDRGPPQKIKRFTWKNHNNIEVQVITYGARVVSIKLPDRKGVVEDVVLGCRDLAGYLEYGGFYLGATIGRFTNRIENGTFSIDGVQYWVQPNDGTDQVNGGGKGFDKVAWEPYVQGNRVILSHTSTHGDEGFPGDLLVRISFELTPKNEFSIDMEAVTTKTTIVNLSNLIYFNLAGHQAGPEETYRHVVTINSNCYTPLKEKGLPTGEIKNVVYTKNDFQIPVVLKTRIGINPNEGYDQNFCVNRGVDQGNCFVARALHTPSGRILEVYGNQCGVNFSTANHFGNGVVDIPVKPRESKIEDRSNNIFVLLDLLYEKVTDSEYHETDITPEIRALLKKIQKCGIEGFKENPSAMLHALNFSHPDFDLSLRFSEIELSYLRHIKRLAERVRNTTTCEEMQRIIAEVLNTALAMDKVSSDRSDPRRNGGESNSSRESKAGDESLIKAEVLGEEDFKPRADEVYELKGMIEVHKDRRLHGKNGVVYKRHGGIAFQTQNYPNAVYHKNFPSCVLNPGQTYRHTIVYKFWVQGGSPARWNKRNC